MKKAQNTFASISYYKKYNFLLFLFFGVSLAILTLLRLLIHFQKNKMILISERWNNLSKFLPGTPSKGFTTIINANLDLQEKYLTMTTVAVSSIAFIGISLTGTLLYHRRKDIKALLSLGVEAWKITIQLIIEALFPIVFSFFAVMIGLLIFQSQIKEQAMSINDQLFTNELPYEVVLKTDVDLTVEAKDSPKLLLPFNAHSFYAIETTESSFGSLQLLKEISQSFIKLFLINLLIITLTSSGSVFYLYKNLYH